MSNKSLQKLSTRFLKRKISSSQKLQKIEKQSSYKQIIPLRGSRKRDAWSHGHKNIEQISPNNQSKLLKSVKLDPLLPRSSLKILQPIDKIDKNSNISAKKYEDTNQMSQIQSEMISKKIRFVTVFERQESQQQKKMRKYFSNFLPKNSQKDLIIIQQAPFTLNKINYFWWKALVTLFENTKFAISNTNIALAKSLALTYFLMEQQRSKSQQQLVRQFQDPSHISIISQYLYFERFICFFICDSQQSPLNQKYELTWTLDSLNKIAIIRSLIFQILNQTEESFLKYNKLKKPSYLIREKKLIQINKIISQMKENINKTLKGSLLTKIFTFDQKSAKVYEDLNQKTAELKQKILNIPRAPFLQLNTERYCLVCDPEGIFYTEDKKNTCLILKPFTELILKQLSKFIDIVIFSKKKLKNIEPFLHQTRYITFAGILDKDYETFKQGRKIKDINKMGINPGKTLVLDMKAQKYYQFHLDHCIPIPKQANQAYYIFLVKKIKRFVDEQNLITQTDVARFFKYHDFSGEQGFKK